MINNIELKSYAKNLRKTILDTAFKAGSKSAHVGGALSAADIVSVLFGKVMNFNKENLNDEKRDRFILSKGHACLAYYAGLVEKGFMSVEKLNTFA